MGNFRFLPDLPPETPDTWTVCDGFHADTAGLTCSGYMAASYLATGLSLAFGWMKNCPYPAASLNGNIVAIFGNSLAPSVAGKVYVYNGSTWNDRTGGTNVYASSRSESTVQYGNITLVGTPANGIFSRDATTTNNFAAISSSPNCDILVNTTRNIVVALGGGTGGSDAWAASDAFDYSNWTTGEAASGNLRQTAGKITAGVAFGNDVIAFKNHGVYRGTYVGGVVKWTWELLRAGLGAWGPGCAINVQDVVYFYGDEGFWSFDGVTFRQLDEGARWTLFAHMSRGVSGNTSNAKMAYDSVNKRIAFFQFGAFTNGSSSRANTSPAHYTYNTASGGWGYQSALIDGGTDAYECVVDDFEVSPSSGAWDHNTSLALFNSTNNDIRCITTPFSGSSAGSVYKPMLRTFRLGTRETMTTVTRAVPRWTLANAAGTDLSSAVKTATPYTSDSANEAETAGTSVQLSTDLNRADYRVTARFQSVEIQCNYDAVLSGVDFVSLDAGTD